MAWAVTASPERFESAIKWFADRMPLTEELSVALGEFAGPRAWTIAGVTQLEVVQHTHDSLLKAIENGTPFEEWKKEVEESLTNAWGRKDSSRIETIFLNGVGQAYSSGRWEQMQEVKDLRPLAMFDGVDDSHQSAFCRAWDGKILPLDEFAARNAVPLCHHRCRSQLRSMREADANRRGGVTKSPPTIKVDEGWGQVPTRSEWLPDPAKHDPKIWNAYQAKAKELEESPRRIAKTG